MTLRATRRHTAGPMDSGWSAHRYLAARVRFGIKFGLDSMQALLGELGHPEQAWPCLLVAGTNGKGSVCAYAAAALQASGLRTGLYTSPHLVRVHERIVVDGRPLSERALQSAVRAVRDAAQRLVARGRLAAHPTYFEVLTAAACVHFRRARVEVAVLEVGLGGRLDATNACQPLASAVVTIDYDHQAWLGDTLASIAREKAGVLRPGRTTVLGPLPAPARRAIEARARATGARLVRAPERARVTERADGLVDVATPRGRYPGLRALPGRHQRDNLLVAVRLLEAAAAAGLPVDLGRLAEATRRTRWPGRLQLVPGRPRLLLDGAHNPAGARALAAHLRLEPPCVLVFGAMQDKDVRELAAPLFARARQVVLTSPRLPRAASPAQLQARTRGLGAQRHRQPSVGRALRLARRLAGPEGLVVVAGSLFLVGEALAWLQAGRAGRR